MAASTLRLQRLDFEGRFLAKGRVSGDWGPTLRGGFGMALRRVACSLRRESCGDCLLGSSCAYGYVFETPILEPNGVMRKYTNAPHPFVFEPALEAQRYVSAGDPLQLSLVVVGVAASYLPYFFLALEELGTAGLGKDSVPFQIDRATVRGGPTVYDRQAGRRFSAVPLLSLSLDPGKSEWKQFAVELDTPLRLVVEGQLTSRPTFLDLIRSLHRRTFLLRHFHCEGNGESLDPVFLECAKSVVSRGDTLEWKDASRFSTRQQRSIPIGGLRGRLHYEGDLGLLRPLLRAGEYVHVGKNATFGLGKFRVVEEQ